MYLAPNIHFARLDRRSVVLDLNRDRYIGLNADLSDALQSLLVSAGEDRELPADSAALAKLLDRGLLTTQSQSKSSRHSQPSNSPQARALRPTESLWARLSDERLSGEPISVAGMISAFVSLTKVATSLRLQSFKSTIAWIANANIAMPRRRSNSGSQTLGAARALIDAFDEVRPYFPLKPICRLDAPSLCLHLRGNGQNAQLVFGVRLDPFAAHCWVQIGELAISEDWDRLRRYTPILVV